MKAMNSQKTLNGKNEAGYNQNKYIVELYDIGIIGDPSSFNAIYLVMEYVKGDLRDLQANVSSLSERRVKKIMYSFLCGIKFLHSARILHRDLKPANLLLKGNQVKIWDYGLARSLVGVYNDDELDYK